MNDSEKQTWYEEMQKLVQRADEEMLEELEATVNEQWARLELKKASDR